jgi:hypothetical protein
MIRNLLPASEVPDAYIEAFDTVVAEHGSGGRINAGGVARTLAAAKLGADAQARIMGVVAPGGGGEELALDRNQFNVLLALIGLAQEGEVASLDGVDERRRSKLFTCLLLFIAHLRLSPPSLIRTTNLPSASIAVVVHAEVGPNFHP